MRLKFAITTVCATLALAVFADVSAQSALSGMSRRSARGSGTDSEGGFDYSLTPSPAAAVQFQQGAAMQAASMVLPSDNSIDENEYMIGSGDVFFISVIESPSIRYTAAVDQSGRAFVQNVGLINIGKTSYAEAKKIIAEYIGSKLRQPSEVYVTLIQTKNATVSFTGNLRNPGSYEFPGATRLLDAIRAANNGDLPHEPNSDLRHVILTNGGDSATYDIMAYLYKGDHSQNPYVYPGDRVRINPTTNSVFISGAIKTPPPSFYPFKEGETLREFLSMFTLDNTADTSNIIIFHSADNSKRTLSDLGMDYVLNNQDAITVPVRKNQPGIYTVSISGEIASPGHYPITENTTSARQLIEMAGGMKETGNADQAVVIRPVKNLPDRLNSGVQHLSMIRPERGASISMASASLDYTVIRLVLYNAEKVILEPGDQIVIPKKDSFVYISGNVRNPGAYPFQQGRDARYYIAQAGGFSGNADKTNVQVFMKFGDLVQNVELSCVEPGSVIVVPSSVQYKLLSQVILPLISTIATTVGVGIAIFTSR